MATKEPKPDIAWIKLQAGTLRVCIETASVEVWHPTWRRWVVKQIFETNQTAVGSHGYLYVKLQMRLGGRRFDQSAFLHRLVKMAFCGERLTPDEQVDHIDGDKSNCHWSNLKVVTGEENLRRRDQREAAELADPNFDPWAYPADAVA